MTCATALLASSAFAAFIQNPIPPSTKDNQLLDRDGDGRLDGISINLLGTVNQEYLDQMVDSLTFDWVDSSNVLTHVVVPRSAFMLESASSRTVFVDLSGLQQGFTQLTALSSEVYPKNQLGNVKMHMSQGSSYSVTVQDKMVPVMTDVVLRSYRGLSTDTLSIRFSESMKVSLGCETFLTFKSADDPEEHMLPVSVALWRQNATEVQILLDEYMNQGIRLAPRDSLRLLQKCIGDSLKNLATDESRFVAVAGFYPMEVLTSAMVYDDQVIQKNTSVFQLIFEKGNAPVPNENAWGVALDVLDEEFLNAVRSTLGLSSKASLDYSKILIHYDVRIYTNLGTFVVGTSADVKGDDSRFSVDGNRLFLKWNVMDGHHRRVGTGVYIADIAVHVSYDGETIYRSDVNHGPTTKIFGVKRR